MPTLHVHADEAGDFNFRSGSKYYVFTAACTRDPYPLAHRLQELRFSLIKNGANIDRFHAAPDHPSHRMQAANLMVAEPDWCFASVVVLKAKLWSMYQRPARFYPRFLRAVLRFVFRGSLLTGVDRVLVFTDRLPNMQAKKEGIEKAIRQACAADLAPRGIPFHVCHHSSASNGWLQVADYCCWAVQRKHENGDSTLYDLLKPRLAAPELVLWS